ncbi:MAG: hypothetical protein QGI80_00405, partial [archaeon]|nr:hypothetical protein [archaeon]
MKLAALFSGGKDSTASLYKAMQDGHEITHLVTALASNPDSYLFHTSAINMAEGEKKSAILHAEGEAEARVKVATAEKEAIDRITEAI